MPEVEYVRRGAVRCVVSYELYLGLPLVSVVVVITKRHTLKKCNSITLKHLCGGRYLQSARYFCEIMPTKRLI